MKKPNAAGLLLAGCISIGVPLFTIRHEEIIYEHPHTYEERQVVFVHEPPKIAVASTTFAFQFDTGPVGSARRYLSDLMNAPPLGSELYLRFVDKSRQETCSVVGQGKTFGRLAVSQEGRNRGSDLFMTHGKNLDQIIHEAMQRIYFWVVS